MHDQSMTTPKDQLIPLWLRYEKRLELLLPQLDLTVVLVFGTIVMGYTSPRIRMTVPKLTVKFHAADAIRCQFRPVLNIPLCTLLGWISCLNCCIVLFMKLNILVQM